MTTRRRRALSAEESTMTPAERAEMRELGFQARYRAQSSRHQHERAIEKSVQRTQPQEIKK